MCVGQFGSRYIQKQQSFIIIILYLLLIYYIGDDTKLMLLYILYFPADIILGNGDHKRLLLIFTDDIITHWSLRPHLFSHFTFSAPHRMGQPKTAGFSALFWVGLEEGMTSH